MKIGINALGLKQGTAGGIESYLYNLLEGLAAIDEEHSYHIFVSYQGLRANIESYRNPRLKIVYVSRIVAALKFIFTRPWIALRFFSMAVSHNLALDGGCTPDYSGLYGRVVDFDKFGLDVIHFPFETLDSSFYGLKSGIALTVHDVQHEYYSDYFDAGELERRRRDYKAAAERADVLLAISGATKNSLIERFGVSPEKIVVTYEGCSPAFRKISDHKFLDSVKEKYSLPERFLFYPAGTWPHKNHIKLLEAVAILRDKYGFDEELVLTGTPQNNHRKVMEAIENFNLTDKVRFLNLVPFEDMPAIYNLASLLVFPSLFEGFGIPLVEAMNVGLPIVCSDRTSIPEVVEGAGIYFDPEDASDMAEKIHRLWNDEALRSDLVKEGFERAKLFNWQQTARKTVHAYELAFKTVNSR
jgi:glycosyltransferase involved in cell wall biosynthesis